MTKRGELIELHPSRAARSTAAGGAQVNDKSGERPARSTAAGGAQVDKSGERPARSTAAGGAQVDDITDPGLVAACAAGDRAARALLFERHVDAVHRFVARMRGSDADAVDDLVQMTFLRAFGAAARFHGTTARAWLHGIAANVVKEHARKEIRRKRALSLVAEFAPAVASPRDPTLARLPGAIAALPHALRAAFVLIDLEGEKGSDAASALGIPQGTLWRHVYEARCALREALHGDDA